MSSSIRLLVSGDFACFTRPEMKSERVSYEVMTPSAARGLLESIYWKPAMTWIIDRIHILKPIQFLIIQRNEISTKAGKNALDNPKYINKNRQQRISRILRDVQYVIEAHIKSTSLSETFKHTEIFKRRAVKGQCFSQPYFGCREFPVDFKIFEESKIPKSNPPEGTFDLGWMLHDIDFSDHMKPKFFHAVIRDGLLEIPQMESTQTMKIDPSVPSMSPLKALYDQYLERLSSGDENIPKPGYDYEGIHFVIELDPNSGEIIDIIDQRDGKLNPKKFSVPYIKRTRAPSPKFLFDNTAYVFGASNKCDSSIKHKMFIDYNKKLLISVKNNDLLSFTKFLNSSNKEMLERECKKFSIPYDDIVDQTVIFSIKKRLLHQLDESVDIWEPEYLKNNSIKDLKGTCLITGKFGSIANLHPSIKGVSGAQSSGANIISFNLNSFESYGMKKGQNSPVSPIAAHGYTSMLNNLLRLKRIRCGNISMVYWTKIVSSPTDLFIQHLLGLSDDYNDTETAKLMITSCLRQLAKGKYPQDEIQKLCNDKQHTLKSNLPCFILGLSPNDARISISFWCVSTLGKLAENAGQHFEDLSLNPRDSKWNDRTPILRDLLFSIFGKDLNKIKLNTFTTTMLRAIFEGTHYPRSLLTLTIMKIKSDFHISWLRVAMIRAYLARKDRFSRQNFNNHSIPILLDLDPTNINIGYRLGRLFAVLAKMQYQAIGSDTGIKEKFYGSASTTPSLSFPILLKNSNHHLSKIKNTNMGTAIYLEKLQSEIIEKIDPDIPKILSIEDQGRFAIGYFHQHKDFFNRKTETKTDGDSD